MEIPLPIIISSLALGVSCLTAWFTFFRKGKLKMTQPMVIYFGPDVSTKTKIFLRTILYSTAKRGQIVESLYVSLKRNETKQNFSIWVYGETGDLKRGSGLFVPQEGVTFNHNFLPPKDVASFNFLSGAYNLRVFAKTVGEQSPHELSSINLTITESLANQLSKPNTGVYFDWSPNQQNYHSHISTATEVDFDEIEFMRRLLETKDELSEKAKSK